MTNQEIEQRAQAYIKSMGNVQDNPYIAGKFLGYIDGATEQEHIDAQKALAMVQDAIEKTKAVILAKTEAWMKKYLPYGVDSYYKDGTANEMNPQDLFNSYKNYIETEKF